MKISQEEIDAAWNYAVMMQRDVTPNGIRSLLEAAYRVRKERKKAKREGRKAAVQSAPITEEDKAWALRELEAQSTPKPLTFEVGKSYRTRDGRKATIDLVGLATIGGMVEGRKGYHAWWITGRDTFTGIERPLDLISEWQD